MRQVATTKLAPSENKILKQEVPNNPILFNIAHENYENN